MNMPRQTIRWILQGDGRLLAYYQRALQIWGELAADPGFADPKRLAAAVQARQTQFELECGDRSLGREVLVISGLGQFYKTETGFEDRLETARNVARAIMISACSQDVKQHTVNVAQLYSLFDPVEMEQLQGQPL